MDRRERERRLVDDGGQPPPLAERADPPCDVSRRPLRGPGVRQGAALAERTKIELRADRHDRNGRRAVDVGDERLEDRGRVEPELLGRLEPVRLGPGIVVVLVQRERDAFPRRRDDRRCPLPRHPVGREGSVGAPMAADVTMDKIVSLARRRGFVFPSSEIYGGLGSSYDYGHYGVLLKENVKARWLEAMVQERDDIVALDSAIILHPKIWEASGHVAGFTDPLVDCRTCKRRFRADHLADEQCGRKPSKRPGETAECDLTEARQFNLMFETRVGPVEETGQRVFLRPETAQGIFVNFKNVAQLARRKPPFGIAQVGKSFRNEITPGNFIFRTLEFEQMEMEFFVPPDTADDWYRYWIDERVAWYVRYGIRPASLRVRPHEPDELSHYSSATSDVEYLYPIGWSELEGIANRGTFDLTAHAEASGTTLEWVDGGSGERYVPAVIEPAAGVNRAMLAFLCDAYDEEVVADRQRTVLRLHPEIAPVKVAVLPLVPREAGMAERARALHQELRRVMVAEHDDGGQIGRRYRRQDEIGTPWALTIDEQTLVDETVTIRDRDSLAQERISIARAREHVLDRLAAPWTPPSRGS